MDPQEVERAALADKLAVVIGASEGIGHAVAVADGPSRRAGGPRRSLR